MYYQPDRQMTISVLTNYSGLDTRLGGLSPYDIAKVLYAALPDFIGGNDNRKVPKIKLCFNGHNMMVARQAAAGFIKKGAYLGYCESTEATPSPAIGKPDLPANGISVFPNPTNQQTTITITAADNGRATLRLVDPDGKIVRVLYNGSMEKGGTQRLTLNVADLAPGMYTVQLQTLKGITQQRIVVMQ